MSLKFLLPVVFLGALAAFSLPAIVTIKPATDLETRKRLGALELRVLKLERILSGPVVSIPDSGCYWWSTEGPPAGALKFRSQGTALWTDAEGRLKRK